MVSMLGSSYSPIIPLLQGGGSSSLLKYLLGEDYEFIDFVADKAAKGRVVLMWDQFGIIHNIVDG